MNNQVLVLRNDKNIFVENVCRNIHIVDNNRPVKLITKNNELYILSLDKKLEFYLTVLNFKITISNQIL